MRRHLLALAGLLGLLAGQAWAWSGSAQMGSGAPAGGQVYTVRALRAGLQEHPAALLGAAVQVRGVAWHCLGWAYGPCLIKAPILTDPDGGAGLALGPRQENSLLTSARALPVVGRLVPASQPIRWSVLSTYAVRLRAVPTTSCTYWPCYEARVLDVAP
jgi:hypothetical protein